MYEYTIPAKAIITYTDHDWRLQNVLCREPRDGELLVQIVASGICHTDQSNVGGIYPRVLGHEGAGHVLQKGPNCSIGVSIGDPVLLSFAHCRKCYFCLKGHPAHCVDQIPLTIQGQDLNFALDLDKGEEEDERLELDKLGRRSVVKAAYFGHSSFSSIALVKESSVVNVKDLVKSEAELKMFAPLGCGIHTGACSVTNVGDLGEEDGFAVFGLGGVGLSAVMVNRHRLYRLYLEIP
jgi:Zn-dependent alcohol dehydrogenase